MTDIATAARGIVFHEIHVHVLPIKSRWIVTTMKSGTRWAIPVGVVLDGAVAYYERNGWDDETEDDYSGTQPTGDALRGIVEVNADFVHEFKEQMWWRLAPAATLLAGDPDENPGSDACWWFEEHGGDIEEMTTLPLHEQLENGRYLCLSQTAYDIVRVEQETRARNRVDLLRYFHCAEETGHA